MAKKNNGKRNNQGMRLGESKRCENCANCLYIGEGRLVCDAGAGDNGQVTVMDEFMPTKQYRICGGKAWVEEVL